MDTRSRVNGLWITFALDFPLLALCLLKISAIRCSDGLSALPSRLLKNRVFELFFSSAVDVPLG